MQSPEWIKKESPNLKLNFADRACHGLLGSSRTVQIKMSEVIAARKESRLKAGVNLIA